MLQPGAFAFRLPENLPFLTLDSLGWTADSTAVYCNDGRQRRDAGHVIFQYTLSGTGRIDIGSQTYDLPPGCGFLVKVPSDHRYYYPPDGQQPWSFIWLNARGEDAIRMWDRIIERQGPIVRLAAGSLPLTLFWELYRAVSVERRTDAADLSVLLYKWTLSLLKPDTHPASEDIDSTHPAIRQAKAYMQDNFSAPVTLKDVAAHCGLSPSYLCRLFQRKENDSPLAFLQRKRVEAAVTMLRRTDISIRSIGIQCGFDSPSYFGKIFRQYLHLSPGEFRKRAAEHPYDVVYLD